MNALKNMNAPIEISYDAQTLAEAIYFGCHAASTASIGIMIQRLLNAETEKLRKENEELKAHLQKSMVIALRQNEH